VAKERLKNFIFRFRISNKLQRLRKLNADSVVSKDSYEYQKAALEIQHLLRYDTEMLVESNQ
jgi:hypothetical protein